MVLLGPISNHVVVLPANQSSPLVNSQHRLQRVPPVARPAPGDDKDGIEALFIVGVARSAGDPLTGAGVQPARVGVAERLFREVKAGAQFHLDEGKAAPAASDEINLASAVAMAASEDAVPTQDEGREGDPLGDPPMGFGSDAARIG
jgi:hypothetical protein